MHFIIKKFRDWSIKSKLLLLTILTLLSILVLSLTSSFFFSTSRTLSIMINGLRVHESLLQSGVDNFYNYQLTKEPKYREQSAFYIDRSNELVNNLLKLREDYKTKKNHEIANYFFDGFPEVFNHEYANAELLVSRFRLLNSLKSEEMDNSRTLSQKAMELTEQIKNQLLKNDVEIDINSLQANIEFIQNHYANISLEVNSLSHKINSALIWAILFISISISVLFLILSRYISRSISMPVKEMVDNFQQIAKGNYRQPLNIKTQDEIGSLAKSFRSIQTDFQNVVSYTRKVANGDLGISLIPKSKEDELSVSLNQMVKTLKHSKAQNDETLWFRSGVNNLNDELQGDHELNEVASKALQYMTAFLRAELGAIYIYKEDQESLCLAASVGIPDKNQYKNIRIGHGLIGQTAATHKFGHIKDVPADYFSIFSGTGEMMPSNIVLVPLVYDNALWGVMELAASKTITDPEIDFIKAVKDSITVKIASTLARIKLETLLKTTQEQASELQVQQEELRVANEELAEQTSILTENEKKLQVQQEELRVANEELEERTNQLEIQKEEIEQKNTGLSLAHEKLETKARELEQASQYKSDFLANMSHELRTPLNSLLILSGMLVKNKNGNLTPEDIESAKIINKSGKDLLQLINEILDLSKIEAGKMTIEMEQVSPFDIKSEVLMDFKHQAEKKGLDFHVNVSDDFPNTIETDQLRLSQIIKNLLSNAFKFTSKGSVSVSMQRVNGDSKLWRDDLKSTETCSICVMDTGVGIPPEKKEAIFEAFQQADGSTSRKYGGTGLGLSISKELARMLGGEIHLESEVNKGSSFTLFVPVKQSTKTPNITNPIKKEVELKIDHSNEAVVLPKFIDDDRDVPQNGASVVLIHPNQEEATNLYYQIHNNSFHALVAANIPDAIQLIESHQPSAVIVGLDLLMEKGEAVLDPLRLHAYASKLPMHIINPVEGILERNINDLPTVNATNITQVIDKMKTQLFTESQKILVIEDDDVTRQLIKSILTPTNVQIEETNTGKEALELISTKKYDCIVLDLGLPDITGNELLAKLTENKVKIPNTIIYTGKELSRSEHRELSKYTNSIILKGLKSDERLMDEVSLFLYQVATTAPENPQVKITEIDDSIFKGKKILVVDDEIRNIFALGKILEEKEMDVLEAENGKIAVDVLKENHNIDLVLMDIMMPEMDGYEAMNIIRKTPEIKDIPIICLTAKAMKEDYQKAITSGANDYLSKPIDENKLFSMLKIWLYN
ncbi:response regulator [Marinifilum sp. D737]|uniref:response regulator n=1 Tax=Marinifilum sp. D737 TaxID=2969628 RepID=UPI002275E3C3|nr:response regulator [Marinifilum sp. D737]MCY1634256.1 response regulator [Marinifilum sp. D737]